MSDRPKLDHEDPAERDHPRSLDELVDFVMEQSFPGSDPPPFWCGGCGRRTFAAWPEGFRRTG